MISIDNLYFTFKRGEVGKQIEFVLSDADGLFDLTDWTVTFALSLDGTNVFSGQACVNDPDQFTNRGVCVHTLNATTANIDPNVRNKTYQGELKAVNGSNVFFWPVDKNNRKTYFQVEVQSPLA